MKPIVFATSLRTMRRSFLWWSLGIVGMVAMMTAVFPSVRGNEALNRYVQDYPEALKRLFSISGNLDYTSASGYLGTELFSFMVPLLLLIAAIAAGSAAIAGEEDRGTLDLLLSLPITRPRLVLEKYAALVAESVGLGLVLWASLWVGARAVGMEIAVSKLAAATVDAVALAIAYGGVALLLGCATGRRGLAIGLTAAAAVAAYLVNSIAPLVGGLDLLQKLSPFYHYAIGDPLRAGLAVSHLLVLLAIAAVTAAAAAVAVGRRDLGT